MRNPYTPWNAEKTVDTGAFVGRRHIWFTDLHARLGRKPDHDRHLLIQGRSGVGKTALLRRIVRHAVRDLRVPRNRVLFLDLGELGLEPLEAVRRIYRALPRDASSRWVRGLPEVLRHIAEAFTFQTPVYGGPSVKVGKLLSPRQPETVASALELVRAALYHLSTGGQALIIVDQLGLAADLAESADERALGPAWAHFLQGLFGVLDDCCCLDGGSSVLFVMAARMDRMGGLVAVKNNMISSVAHIETLQGLSADEARRLVTEPAEREGIGYSSDTVELLLERGRYTSFGLPGDAVGINPMALQTACWSLWEWLRIEGRLVADRPVSVNVTQMNAALDSVFGPQVAGFDEDERIVLQIIADDGATVEADLVRRAAAGGVSDPDRVISCLCRQKAQIVRYVRQRKSYTIAHDLLREYLVRSIPLAELGLLRAQRLLEDAPRRARVGSPLVGPELDELWQWRGRLNPTTEQLAAVIEADAESGPCRVEEWAEHSPELVVRALQQLTENSQFAWTRCWATEELGNHGKAALSDLRGLATLAQDDMVRVLAAEHLARAGERDIAVSALTEVAQAGHGKEARLAAALNLVGLEERGIAVSILLELIQAECAAGVREKAVDHLVELGEREAIISFLRTLVTAGRDWKVREQAVDCLAKLGERRVVVTALRGFLASPRSDMDRLQAARLLKGLEEADVSLSELSLLTGSADPYVRDTARHLLID